MSKDYFYIALRNLKSRPLRSWLTILGIVIGVFLVMSLLSLSQGIKGAVLQQLRMMGSDIIMVYPGELTNIMAAFAGGLKLSDEDIRAIKRAEGVESVIPELWKARTIRYEGKSKTVFLYGVPFNKSTVKILKEKMGFDVKEGRFPGFGKNEILIGKLVAENIFPGIKVGTRAYIAGKRFEVVGVLKSLGNKSDDSMVGVDLDIYRKITGERKGAQFVIVAIKKGFSQEEVAENIKRELRATRKKSIREDSPNFSVITSEKAMGLVNNIMSIIQAAIFAIAGFAILVGAIGIMNTMFTAVRERTKEIGIMKAIGAKTSDITLIFLIESGIMGMIGGIGGTILGVGAAKMVELFLQFHPVFYLKAYISLPFILFGLVFTFLVGCISGYLPSRKAASLKPVDALHYE
jgi:putative ABC transport system permease protein